MVRPNRRDAQPKAQLGGLSRREFLLLAGASLGGLGLQDALPSPESGNRVKFWDSVYSIYKLKIDPRSIKLESIDSEDWQEQTVLTFLSKKKNLSSTDPSKNNPLSKASKITITFIADDRQQEQRNIKTAANLGAFITAATRFGQAVDVFKTGSAVAAAAIIAREEEPFWKSCKLPIAVVVVGGTVVLAGCAGQLSMTQETEEGRQATATLTSLATQGEAESPTSKPTAVETQVIPQPEIPDHFEATRISSDYLTENWAIIQQNNKETQPSPTFVPYQDEIQQGIDPIEYTKSHFRLKEIGPKDPLSILKFLVAQGSNHDTNGGVTWFQPGVNNEQVAFANLSIYREALEPVEDRSIQGEYIANISIPNDNSNVGYPRNLNLKYGKPENEDIGPGFSIVGMGRDGNIVIAFEEFNSRGEEEFSEPRICLAVITLEELWNISTQYLGKLDYYLESPEQIQFQDWTAGLNIIEDDLMKMVYVDAGAVWIERYSNEPGVEPKELFHPEPVVPFLQNEVLQSIGIPNEQALKYVVKTNEARRGHVRSITVQSIDKANNLQLISEFNRNNKEWVWKEPNWKNLSEMLGFNLGDSTLGSFDYYDTDFQNALKENFTMLNPGSFMAHRFEQDKKISNLFLRLTRDNDQALVIQSLFWNLMLPNEIYYYDDETLKQWMRNRVKKVFDYIHPIEPGGKPTMLVIGNEFLFWINPLDGSFADPVPQQVDGKWIDNPYSRVYGNSTTALTEMYMMVIEEASQRGLNIGKDFIPNYTDFNNHINHVRGSKTKELVRRLNQVKDNVGQNLRIPASDVLLSVGIQGNFFYKDLPSFVVRPPDVEEFKEAINSQKQVGPVILFDLNIVGLNQTEKKIKYQEYIKAVMETGCLGLTFWKALLSSSRPEQKGDAQIHDRDPADLFDPFNGYKPIPGNGYDEVTHTLLAEAENRGLVG